MKSLEVVADTDVGLTEEGQREGVLHLRDVVHLVFRLIGGEVEAAEAQGQAEVLAGQDFKVSHFNRGDK